MFFADAVGITKPVDFFDLLLFNNLGRTLHSSFSLLTHHMANGAILFQKWRVNKTTAFFSFENITVTADTISFSGNSNARIKRGEKHACQKKSQCKITIFFQRSDLWFPWPWPFDDHP